MILAARIKMTRLVMHNTTLLDKTDLGHALPKYIVHFENLSTF